MQGNCSVTEWKSQSDSTNLLSEDGAEAMTHRERRFGAGRKVRNFRNLLRRNNSAYRALSASNLFDANYYLHSNPDVVLSGADPLSHFLNHGAAELRDPSDFFNTEFYLKNNPGLRESGVNPLLHYLQEGLAENQPTMPYPDTCNSYIRAVQECGYFDPSYYLSTYKEVARAGVAPFDHFMRNGWCEYMNPSLGFDLIWYTQTYLNCDFEKNALLHFVTEGKVAGNLPAPRLPVRFDTPTSYADRETPLRRICLFAGYDADGIIDQTVVEYITDLSRHSDVYYLADCHISTNELKKLEGITKGAWAARHGCYDFGSWSRLTRELVGWEEIGTYDELIFANDSAWLMRSFDQVFAEMDGRDCDWWGLQATKGTIATFAAQRVPEEIGLDEIKSDWLDSFERDQMYDFHIGSYFLVFRKPVLSDPKFRRIIDAVREERNKLTIIRKYEIGITRFLISQGYEFETLVRTVYPCQPVYTEMCFDLIGKGFPLLKKYHLIENHYKVPEIFDWPNMVRSSGIEKDLTPYLDNLRRTGNAEKMYKNQHIFRSGAHPPLSPAQLVELDPEVPKYDNWWAFPVCAYNHQFNDNARALFEYVKNDPSIKKIILTRGRAVDVDGKNVVILPLNSRDGQFYLLRARHIFLKHGVGANIGAALSKEHHGLHNLWHGIPLKRIGYASLYLQEALDIVEKENRMLSSVICASKIDQLAMTAAYYPLTINDIWMTGLPRHDLILMAEEDLPTDMIAQLAQLRTQLAGRKLVMFAPTFRLDQENGYYSFSDEEVAQLSELLHDNNAVIGVREHMADKKRQYSTQLSGPDYIELPDTLFPHVEILMRETAALVTDYSSVFIDFLITGRPVISFAYDYDNYVNSERGTFYDLDWCFPGEITMDFKSLYSAIADSFAGMTDSQRLNYEHRRRLFIENYDGRNAERVARKVHDLQLGSTTYFDIKECPLEGNLGNNILWVYDATEEITARYRIYNIVPEFLKNRWASRIVTSDQLTADMMRPAAVVVFCRVKATDEILDFAEGARRAGRKVVFDIDDLIFDETILNQFEYYNKRFEARGRLRDTVRRYQHLLREADLVTVSTESLKCHVEKMGLISLVVPNSLGSGLIQRYGGEAEKPLRLPNTSDPVRICYLSGTQTHGDDFRQIRDIVREIMAERDNVEFHIVGKISINEEENDEALAGWIRHQRMSYEAMHSFLHDMDINLAPLTTSLFNDCKSELKIFEAGLHRVPTIASATTSYRECIVNGKTGILAKSHDDWKAAIINLIDNSNLRRDIGRGAYDTALSNFAAKNVAQGYLDYITGTLLNMRP